MSVLAVLAVAGDGLDRGKAGDVLRGPRDVANPRATHPAFYGSFDWHSCVHGHWLVVRLLRLFPDQADAAGARARLAAHLTAANLAAEAAYFEPRENRGFERMYGWAWTLRLAAELKAWDDANARQLTMRGIASALPAGDARRAVLDRASKLHEAAGLKHVFSGHYEGDHWLATFAVYHVSDAGIEAPRAR